MKSSNSRTKVKHPGGSQEAGEPDRRPKDEDLARLTRVLEALVD